MVRKLLLSTVLVLASCAPGSGSIGGADYDPAYDFSDFSRVTAGRTFRVIVAGHPFPSIAPADIRSRLLPVMQAHRPRPRPTFTYAAPPSRSVPTPDGAGVRTANTSRPSASAPADPPRPGPAAGFGVRRLRRNDRALSRAVASATATSRKIPGRRVVPVSLPGAVHGHPASRSSALCVHPGPLARRSPQRTGSHSTSSMCLAPVASITSRSKPSAMPAQSGSP